MIRPLSIVQLRQPIAGVPAGALGTVVHRWKDAPTRLLVEFTEPACVIDVDRSEVKQRYRLMSSYAYLHHAKPQ